ncbi:MAG: flippase-like domain-containing protein, partial [Schwartzia sp.]|nr:flippase-like domain-containing protein [Schwartzia sp. (in: firmicutes)]
LRHAGVPTGKATVLVFVRTVVSILFLILCLPFIFMHDSHILPGVSNEYLAGISIAAFLIILFLILGMKSKMLNKIAVRIAKKLSPARRRTFLKGYRDTQNAVRLLYASPWAMLLVFLESGLSLIAIYAIVPCLMLGLGVTDADWYAVMGKMIFLNMLLYFMPTPGGSGIAEGGFVLLFTDIVPAGTVGIVAVCWRFIAEYIPFLIGFYYTIKVFGAGFLNKK